MPDYGAWQCRSQIPYISSLPFLLSILPLFHQSISPSFLPSLPPFQLTCFDLTNPASLQASYPGIVHGEDSSHPCFRMNDIYILYIYTFKWWLSLQWKVIFGCPSLSFEAPSFIHPLCYLHCKTVTETWVMTGWGFEAGEKAQESASWFVVWQQFSPMFFWQCWE